MSCLAAEHNPFMLMLNPEVILAAVEKSERLNQLNRHMCRPLDRVGPAATPANPLRSAAVVNLNEDEDDEDSSVV